VGIPEFKTLRFLPLLRPVSTLRRLGSSLALPVDSHETYDGQLQEIRSYVSGAVSQMHGSPH